jgi:hypothetical protein
LREYKEFKQFQIVQESIDRYTINYVADVPLSPGSQERLRVDFAEFLGSCASVGYQRLPEIPRTAGRKFMLAISRLATT